MEICSHNYTLRSISVGQAAHDSEIVQRFMTLTALCMHGLVSVTNFVKINKNPCSYKQLFT